MTIALMKSELFVLNCNHLTSKVKRLKAVRTGLEPATPCVTGMYSNQLNYRTIIFEGIKHVREPVECLPTRPSR